MWEDDDHLTTVHVIKPKKSGDVKVEDLPCGECQGGWQFFMVKSSPPVPCFEDCTCMFFWYQIQISLLLILKIAIMIRLSAAKYQSLYVNR